MCEVKSLTLIWWIMQTANFCRCIRRFPLKDILLMTSFRVLLYELKVETRVGVTPPRLHMSRCHWILFSTLLPQYLMCKPQQQSAQPRTAVAVGSCCCSPEPSLRQLSRLSDDTWTVHWGKFRVQSSYNLVNWIFSCEGHLKFKSDQI